MVPKKSKTTIRPWFAKEPMAEYVATSEEEHKTAAQMAVSLRRALEEVDSKIAKMEFAVSSPQKSID
eukprot:5337499-Prorocentrum_lima.AAC.1